MNRSGSAELAKDKEEEDEEEDEQDVPARALAFDMDVSASPALQCLDERRESYEEEDEEEDEQDVPARALAFDMDVSASPALQCLDEMFSSGQVNVMKVARLKASYKLLHDTLRRAQASEERLLQEAHRSRVRLKELRVQEVQAEEEGEEEQEEHAAAPPPPGVEGPRLRQQLLRALNEQEVAQRRESPRRLALQRLLEEKLRLEKKSVKLQPVSLDALRERREELTREVTRRTLEVRNLTDEIEATRSKTLQQQKELEDNKEVIEKMQAERAQLLMVPNQLLKETDRVRHRKADAEQRAASLEAEAGLLKAQLTEAEGRQRGLEEEKRDLGLERRELGARVEAAAEEHREALRGRAAAKENKLSVLGERDILEMKLMDLETDSRLLNESHYIQLKEKDRQLRASKQMELTLKQATDQLVETQSLYSNAKSQRDAWLKGDGGGGVAQRKAELQREVDSLKANLKHQCGLAEEGDSVERLAQVQALIREAGCLSSELHSLGRLTQIKTVEKDQKHRQLRTAEQTNTRVEQERRENGLVVVDLRKLQTALQNRISQRAEACSVVQGERNRHLAQQDLVSREIAELMEKSDALDIEVEILRREAIKKDRTLAEARKKHSQSHKRQESLCKDISKVDRSLRETDEQREENATEEHKLRQDVAKRERSLIAMSQGYQAATHRRNALGIQLLECDTKCRLLSQKHERQGSEVAAGNAALDALEEEVRTLRLDATEEQRCVGLEAERATHTRRLEEELDTLCRELSKVRVQISGLDSGLDFSAGDPSSVVQELQGSGAPAPHLIQKTQQLEERLAKCEEQLMEKELLLDQVTRLSQPIREQVDNAQQERLQMAKKLNALRAQSSVADQRLMAVTAELSMRQAQALALQREARERHLQVEACERRLEQGLPPCLEVEEEWRRLLRDRRRRQKEAQEREERLEEEERSQLPGGAYTTAEPRPNAYIPSQGPLLLPRPYGALAPFKPAEPGANIRHIRKPRLKPIEK